MDRVDGGIESELVKYWKGVYLDNFAPVAFIAPTALVAPVLQVTGTTGNRLVRSRRSWAHGDNAHGG